MSNPQNDHTQNLTDVEKLAAHKQLIEEDVPHYDDLLKGTTTLCEFTKGILVLLAMLYGFGSWRYYTLIKGLLPVNDNNTILGIVIATLIIHFFVILLIWVLLSAISSACHWAIHVGKNVQMIRELTPEPSQNEFPLPSENRNRTHH